MISISSTMSGRNGQTRGCNFDSEHRYKFIDFEDTDNSNMDASGSVDFQRTGISNEAGTNLVAKHFQHSIPSHLLIIALLEHICTLYDPTSSNRELFQVLCAQLSDLKVIPSFAILDDFKAVRDSFQTVLSDFISMAMKTITLKEDMRGVERPLSWKYSIANGNRQGSSRLLRSNSRYKNEFEEIEVLGEGGFGFVYEVRNKVDGKRYAVKKIKLANFHPNDCLKVLREVKVLANLENAHIVRYYSAWIEYSFSEDIEKNTSEYSNESISGFGRWPFFRQSPLKLQSSNVLPTMDDQSATTDSNFSDSISFVDSSKEVMLPHDSKAQSCQCSSNSHQNDNERIGDDLLSNQGRFGDSLLERNSWSLSHNHALIKRRALSFGAQGVHFCNSFPGRSTMVFAEEQIKTIVLYVHIQMELCSGTLKDWIVRRNDGVFTHGTKLEMSKAIDIFHQLLLGVSYIHSKSVIHRDLKPCNIFLGTTGESNEFIIKIGDFGLARSMEYGTDAIFPTKQGNVEDYFDEKDYQFVTKGIGTCIYAAPEQILTNCYSFKADIFSLGIVLFELLVPFKTGMERHSLLTELRHSHIPQTLVASWPEMSESLRQMIDADPDKRPNASSLLNMPHFNDKDLTIKLLRLELAEKARTIAHLQELLQKN